LTAAKNAGLNVFRTWGFNDKNVTYIPEGLPQYGGEGAGGTEVIFQRWANGKSTIDIKAFDKVVNAASKTGIKLIVALTNNWADYGGMDVYTVNLGGKYHDDVCLRPFSHTSMAADFINSSTAFLRSGRLTSATLRQSSLDTKTILPSLLGSSPTKPVAVQTAYATSRDQTIAPPN
jgi:endo-1,4-beta-mannosidase